MRRLGERPANVAFVLRSILREAESATRIEFRAKSADPHPDSHADFASDFDSG